MPKLKNSNATILVIFKHCASVQKLVGYLFALLSVLSAEFKSPELSLILFRLLLLLTFEATTLMILKMDKSKAKMLKVPIDSDPEKLQLNLN